MSSAHILQTKSQDHATMRSFDFRKNLITELVQGRCFRKDTGLPQLPVPLLDIRFNRDHFHYLVTSETRSTCKVHFCMSSERKFYALSENIWVCEVWF